MIMNRKRRRAYKRYDWQRHSLELLNVQLRNIMMKSAVNAIDLAILYGADRVMFEESIVTIKAGLWKIQIPVRRAFLKESAE